MFAAVWPFLVRFTAIKEPVVNIVNPKTHAYAFSQAANSRIPKVAR